MDLEHIYWFAPYNITCPSTRYRGKYPLQHLQKHHNISYDFVLPDRSLNGLFFFLKTFLTILFFRKKNSLLVIQKICSDRWYANALKLLVLFRKNATLYDIDDAEYFRQPTSTLHFFLKHCQKVAVGSQALKEYCLVYNSNVYIQTSPVLKHSHSKKEKTTPLHIGWVGDFGNGRSISKNFSHKTSLYQLLFPALLEINIPIQLSLIGIKNLEDIPEIQSYFKEKPNIHLEIPTHLNWETDEWLYPLIARFDIGVSPMVDHPFNQAKSAFKAKQYLSCGVPVVGSAIGENYKFVQHQYNGLLCREVEDFKLALEKFAQMSKNEYLKFSKNALLNYPNYSMAAYCQLLLEQHSP
jgi:glycosyltransferase involved in cell wall biosynthesis